MRAPDSVPPLSGGVAHAMAAGAKVGVSAGADRRRCAPLFPPQMSPRISVMFRKRIRCVLTGDSGARFRDGKLGVMPTPAITRSSLDLCSAPSRLVASLRPRDRERLSALTAPARRSPIGNCVMAGLRLESAGDLLQLIQLAPADRLDALGQECAQLSALIEG